ncbi:hypothetical protein WR25_04731 [Diploscapter pachys]|uniref:cardiolipin synthase (CMP-forming) n=1 Tax=Diploscapter pachys TaxID=2018661 RepID=A0A2A2L608_9BILA|nr:hypothetical protein WR25_04731 [Diploscapter pachys]
MYPSFLNFVSFRSFSDQPKLDFEKEKGLFKIATIPNALCVARIAATPVIGYLIVVESFGTAFSLFLAAGVTDLLDGYIARNVPGQHSLLGSVLDPIADKLLISTMFVTMTYAALIPIYLTSIVLLRDVCLIVGGFYKRYKMMQPPYSLDRFFNPQVSSMQIVPTLVSKVNTVLQITLVAASLASPIFEFSADANTGIFYLGIQLAQSRFQSSSCLLACQSAQTNSFAPSHCLRSVSGNKVYIHPISGDLQQCSQQLGSYNESSCPGGTVCERFPILIPGFQKFLKKQLFPYQKKVEGIRKNQTKKVEGIKRSRTKKPCYQGYRCEFNREIRRFICCGKEEEMVPPAGLPPIPAPKPLIPRPFRPSGGGPYGLLNDGEPEAITVVNRGTRRLSAKGHGQNHGYSPLHGCEENGECPPLDPCNGCGSMPIGPGQMSSIRPPMQPIENGDRNSEPMGWEQGSSFRPPTVDRPLERPERGRPSPGPSPNQILPPPNEPRMHRPTPTMKPHNPSNNFGDGEQLREQMQMPPPSSSLNRPMEKLQKRPNAPSQIRPCPLQGPKGFPFSETSHELPSPYNVQSWGTTEELRPPQFSSRKNTGDWDRQDGHNRPQPMAPPPEKPRQIIPPPLQPRGPESFPTFEGESNRFSSHEFGGRNINGNPNQNQNNANHFPNQPSPNENMNNNRGGESWGCPMERPPTVNNADGPRSGDMNEMNRPINAPHSERNGPSCCNNNNNEPRNENMGSGNMNNGQQAPINVPNCCNQMNGNANMPPRNGGGPVNHPQPQPHSGSHGCNGMGCDMDCGKYFNGCSMQSMNNHNNHRPPQKEMPPMNNMNQQQHIDPPTPRNMQSPMKHRCPERGINGECGNGMRNGEMKPVCPAGLEYRDHPSSPAPRCIPPAIDSCPPSHPSCILSPSIGHTVCCISKS